ncbi:MAG: tetratricopeptide repeat protein [Pseudomonadota bacterium]
MSDIFEEVEEGYRQDKLAEAWKRFGPIVWVAAFLLIGGVAWSEWNKVQASERQSDQIQIFETARNALDAGEYATAQTGFRSLADSESDVSSVAQHLLADALYKGNGDAQAAALELQSVADLEDPLGKLARLKSAYLTADTLSVEELETALAGLHEEDGPIGVLALELIAARAFASGDLKRAREEFSYLRLASNAPRGVVERAELALSIIPIVRDTEIESGGAVDELPFDEVAPQSPEEGASQ